MAQARKNMNTVIVNIKIMWINHRNENKFYITRVVNHLTRCHLLLYLNKTKHVGTINILKINRTMHLVIMTVLSRASAMSNI